MKIAIIPARGGSKRIPRKNIKEFSGKPMIAYSIECALSSGLFDRVVVSTDDEEIAEVSRSYGAEVPFKRPEELAGDFVGNAAVMVHAIEWLLREGAAISAICCIYPTAPFLEEADLVKGYEVFKKGTWDLVFSATTYRYPIFRSFEKCDDGGLRMFFPEHFKSRSQDLPEAYHDAGQFYWGHSKSWHDRSGGFNEKNSIVNIPSWRVQDIDTPEDFKRAEMMWKALNNEKYGE